MKYFIGTKFNAKSLNDEKNDLEKIMSEIGVEKEDKRTEKELISKMEEDICRNIFITRDFVKEFIKYNTLFLEDETQNIIGFLIFDIDDKNSYVRVHYLCSMVTYKGNGKILLDKIKEYSKKANINKIILSPAYKKEVIQYYENNGFEVEGWEMVYTIKGGKNIISGFARNEIKGGRKSKKRDVNKKRKSIKKRRRMK